MGRAHLGVGHAVGGDESREPAGRRVRLRVHVVGVGRPGDAGGVPKAPTPDAAPWGQYITVIPSLDMVVAHKTVPEVATPWEDYVGILTRLVAAHCGKGCRP